ncbi:MAG: ABC transporter ATP-binding protein, partial [Alphaproteobacteria bacterium]|nr:ABC transporter ATP-binding protein [Alphaproteobacteria bacterium]
PITGKGFETPDATQNFMRLVIGFPEFLAGWFGQQWTLLQGIPLERTSYLFALSFAFLALVGFNGFLKYLVNTMKGRLGERLLRRLRYELIDRVLRFPFSHLRKAKQSEIASMVKDEVEPLGGFTGDAIVWPVFLAGQALTALIFILVQSFWLGLVSAAVVLAQALVIPRLRRPILQLGKMRQLQARELAGRVGEIVDGGQDIRVHGTSNWERADIVRRLGRIFDIRFELYQRKYFVKSLNNFMAQMTPFIFYAVGGYFVITGQLDVGQLVAVIVAYKDLPGPIKELIDWDLQRQDVEIKYDQVMDQFHPEGIALPEMQAPLEDRAPLGGPIELKNITALDDAGFTLLDDVDLILPLDQSVAVVGPAGCGKEALGLLFARQITLKNGTIKAGDADFATMSESVVGRRIAYTGPDGYFFPLDLKDNLLYGLKLELQRSLPTDIRTKETLRAGNPEFDVERDWIDYAALGSTDPAMIMDRIVDILKAVALEGDVYQFGLQSRLDPKASTAAKARIVDARLALHERLAAPDLAHLVERFDPASFNRNASIAENILFGSSVDPLLQPHTLPKLPHFQRVVAEEGLEQHLVAMGLSIAETMLELFRDFPPDHPFFDEFSFIPASELPAYQQVMKRAKTAGLTFADRAQLSVLPLRYVEARHRLGLITDEIRERLLAARRTFAQTLPPELASRIAFYDEDTYNPAASLQDNILLGRIAYGVAQAGERVNVLIREVLDQLDVRDLVIESGLAFHAGSGGKRLTPGQRQKLGLARALIKEPDLLVVNGALANLDDQQKTEIVESVLARRQGRGTLWILTKDDLASRFDRTLVFEHGRLVADKARTEQREAAQ